MTSITSGGVTRTPILVEGYKATRSARNIIHDTAATDVTLRPAGLRKGTLNMLCETLADALAIEALHLPAVVITFSDATVGPMYYVASGDIDVEQDDATGTMWWVRVAFQEVSL